jgi:transposase
MATDFSIAHTPTSDRMSSLEPTLECRTQDWFEIRAAVDDASARAVSEITSCLTASDRDALLKRARSRTLAARIVLRSRIVLLAADGVPASAIGRRLGTTSKTVALWLRRFAAGGLDALAKDALGRGRKRSIPPSVVAAVRAAATSGLTVREIARRAGISAASVVRLSRNQQKAIVKRASRRSRS